VRMKAIVFSLLLLLSSVASLRSRPQHEVHSSRPKNDFSSYNETLRLMMATNHLPGFSTIFSQKGLDYFSDVGIDVLNQAVSKIQVPDMSGDIGALGGIHYTLTQVKTSSMSFSQGTILPVDMQILKCLEVGIKSFKTDATVHWDYKRNSWPQITGSGDARLHVEAEISVYVSLTNVNEHLQAQVVGQSVNIKTLDINVYNGKGSDFYNFILKLVHNDIKNAISSQLGQAIKANVEGGLNKVLMNFLVMQNLGSNIMFDIGMSRNPMYDLDLLTLFESGESSIKGSDAECPTSVCPQYDLPISKPDTAVRMFLSEYVASSLAYVTQKSGLMVINLGSNDVPAGSIVKLNTDFLRGAIPALYNQYPGKNVSIQSNVDSSPIVKFTPKGATVKATGLMRVFVEGVSKPVFILTGDMTSSGVAILDNWTLKGQLFYINSTWNILQSDIGLFPMAPVQYLMDFFATAVVIPQVNQKLSSGIALPSVDGLKFLDTKVSWSDHYLMLDTEVEYKPKVG